MRKNKFFVKSPIICEPRDNMSRALYIVGWISRALVHFVCVFGSCLFIADSFGITSSYIAENNASIGMLALTCLIVSAVTSLCAYNGKTLLITPPVAVLLFVGILAVFGNPVTLIWDGIRCVWNTGIHRLGEKGFISFASYILSPDAYSYNISVCLNVGMTVVAAVFGIIFGFCLIRRGKLLPSAIVCIIILVPVLSITLREQTQV